MKSENYKARMVIAIGSLALASMSSFVYAQSSTVKGTTGSGSSGTSAGSNAAGTGSSAGNQPATSRSSNEDARDARQQLNKAVTVVDEMKRDPQMKARLQQAQGVFLVPDYGRAAAVVGGRGGEGVLMVKHNGKWGDPAFYTLGGVSLGLQAGVETGEIALVLNNQKALDSFKQDNNWSLNAEAGLTIVNWSPKAQGSVGKGDVIVWANTEGLFGNTAVSITDIHFDEEETGAFYGKKVALTDIIGGTVHAPARQVAAIKRALPSGSSSGATSVGSSGGATGQGSSDASSGTSGMQRNSSGMGTGSSSGKAK